MALRCGSGWRRKYCVFRAACRAVALSRRRPAARYAARIGARRETVSISLRSLVEEGVIEVSPRAIIIPRPATLRDSSICDCRGFGGQVQRDDAGLSGFKRGTGKSRKLFFRHDVLRTCWRTVGSMAHRAGIDSERLCPDILSDWLCQLTY